MNQENGHQKNVNGAQKTQRNQIATVNKNNGSSESLKTNYFTLAPDSEQAVVLKQPSTWSRAIIWTIMGVATAGILWAAIAKIEQVVPAQGQLKPQGTVKKIQAPVNGVVKEVFVEDGEHVKKGELLVTMDSTASLSELNSFKKIRNSLVQENQFYRTLMAQSLGSTQVETSIARLGLPKEVAALARNRAAYVAENELFETQLGSSPANRNLNSEQRARLNVARLESDSRAAEARLDKEQLQKQLSQNQVKLADARAQLIADKLVLAEIQTRNQRELTQAQSSLAIENKILSQVEPLVEEGALGSLSYQRQQQEVNDRLATLVEKQGNGTLEDKKQQQQVQTRQAEVEQLLEEEQRLRLGIAQAQEKLTNTTALTEKDIRDKIAENQKKIAEIDSQLNQKLVENDKRIAELDSEISRAQVTLNYQELRSPVSGTVFDLQASPGFVPQPSQAEPLLKIVPDDHLIAEVDITNKDIGFVRPGMKTDVRIDSFPFSEFGDIKGKVLSIGSDALPPDEIHQYYRFPTKIDLDEQALVIDGREIPLQSGMSVSVNIKVREERTVLSLFTELFTEKLETLKEVR